MNPDNRTALASAIGALLLLPWLNPHAAGPSATVQPWLFSVFVAALVWGLATPRTRAASPVIAALLAATAIWTGLMSGLTPEVLALILSFIVIVSMASVSADAAERFPQLISAIAAAWLVAALISSVIALCQYFGVASHFDFFMSAAPAGEPYANLRQRNQFASLTSIGFAALLWRAPRMGGLPAIACALLLAMANASSASRTGLLQLVMLGVFSAVWPHPDRRQRLMLCAAAAAGYLLGALVLPLLLMAFTGVSPDTVWGRIARGDGCGSRLLLWSNVTRLIFERPWTGWGWGELDFAHYMTLYPGPRFCDILDNAHDLPLHLAVELGIPAMVVICTVFVTALLRARPWRESDATRQMAWSIVAVILLHNLLEYPLWYGPFQIAFGLCLGLLWRGPPSPAFADSPASVTIQRSAAVVLIVSLGYAAWDYHRVSQIYTAFESREPAYRDDTLDKIRNSWLFGSQARFAELTITPLTRENAQWTYDTALAMLHFSPEPRVIEKVIESAVMLGRDDQAALHLARFQAAFPKEHARWAASHACAMPVGPAAQDCQRLKD